MSLASTLGDIAELVARAHAEAEEEIEGMDSVALAEVLVAIKGAKGGDKGVAWLLSDIGRQATAALASRLPRRATLGPWEVETYRNSGSWVMDSARLAEVVAAGAIEDHVRANDGEIPPIGVLAHLAVERLLETANLDRAWRVGPLKKYGLDPESFGERTAGGPSVSITWREADDAA